MDKKRAYTAGTLIVLLLVGYGFFVQRNVMLIHTQTLTDPLFYDPAINTSELYTAIAALRESQAGLQSALDDYLDSTQAESLSHNQKQALQQIAATNLFPLDYLQSLSTSIDTQRVFIEEPTIATAIAVLKTNTATARAYQQEATHLLQLFDAAVRAEGYDITPFTTRFFGSLSDTTQQQNDLVLLQANGDALYQESRSRWRCLLLGLSCINTSENHIDFVPLEVATTNTMEILPITIALYTYNPTPQTVYGPYIVQSGCFPEEQVPMYVTIDATNRFIAKTAHENYYYDITALQERTQGTGYLSDYEKPYYFQHESTPYRCLDMNYWADLGTMVFIADETQSTEKDHESEQTNPRYKLATENKLYLLPQMLVTVSSYLDVNTEIFTAHQPIQSPTQLLALRSAYGLTYQPFARSIWRLEEKPTYMTRRNTPLADVYVPYSELLTRYSADEILEFHPIVKSN